MGYHTQIRVDQWCWYTDFLVGIPAELENGVFWPVPCVFAIFWVIFFAYVCDFIKFTLHEDRCGYENDKKQLNILFSGIREAVKIGKVRWGISKCETH